MSVIIRLEISVSPPKLIIFRKKESDHAICGLQGVHGGKQKDNRSLTTAPQKWQSRTFMKHATGSTQAFAERLLCSQLAGEGQAKSASLEAHCQGLHRPSNASRTPWGRELRLGSKREPNRNVAERLQQHRSKRLFGSVWVWDKFSLCIPDQSCNPASTY